MPLNLQIKRRRKIPLNQVRVKLLVMTQMKIQIQKAEKIY